MYSVNVGGMKLSRTYIVVAIFGQKSYPFPSERSPIDHGCQGIFGRGDIMKQAAITETAVRGAVGNGRTLWVMFGNSLE